MCGVFTEITKKKGHVIRQLGFSIFVKPSKKGVHMSTFKISVGKVALNYYIEEPPKRISKTNSMTSLMQKFPLEMCGMLAIPTMN